MIFIMALSRIEVRNNKMKGLKHVSECAQLYETFLLPIEMITDCATFCSYNCR